MFCKVTSNSLLNNSVFSFSFRIIPETQSESTQSPVKGKMKNRKQILSDTDSSQDSQTKKRFRTKRKRGGRRGSEIGIPGPYSFSPPRPKRLSDYNELMPLHDSNDMTPSAEKQHFISLAPESPFNSDISLSLEMETTTTSSNTTNTSDNSCNV